jgi:hypothetical protein
MTNPAARQLYNYLSDVMRHPHKAKLDIEQLPEDFREFGRELVGFCESVMQARSLAEDLAQGRLDTPLPPRDNLVADPLKSLHAALRHLTWQTQQVAAGDYQQRVEFMGDFSAAFNTMVERLERQRTALQRELDSWRVENHTLRQNTSLYEKLMRHIARSIIVADAQTGDWMYVSEEIQAMLSGVEDIRLLNRWMGDQLRSGEFSTRTAQLEIEMTDGVHYYLVSIHPMRWLSRDAAAFVFTDISGERREIENLQSIAHYDALTGLLNRYRCMQVLDQWLSERRRFVLCFVDVDNLKYINDHFSHRAGDQYLLRVADGLREAFRAPWPFGLAGTNFCCWPSVSPMRPKPSSSGCAAV